MRGCLRLPHVVLALSGVAFHGGALAVNGALPGGNGTKNASMGGASIALPLDAVAAANNPAGMAFVPSSTTFGLQVFRGQSSADYVLPGNHLENSQTELAPEGGLVWQLDNGFTVGISIAGAGAGSDYGQPALPVPGAGTAKTTLRVAEFIPTMAWKPTPELALGVGLTLAYQQFEADGVIVPAPVPGGLLPLPSHGRQSAAGVGLRAGVLWKPTAEWSFGANLKSRVRMSGLDGYEQDLLAYSDGRLDVPAQYGVGVAWQPTERLTLAADWLRILWGEIKAMQDPNGFAWKNQPVLRFGASWLLDERWTLRAGYSHNRSQIDSSRTVQNLLVPSIHEQAYTAGLSWRVDPRSELNLGYELNPRTTLTGTGASAGTSLTSKVQMLLLGYHYKF
ncbi:long-chain fatty acid transport protein [Rivibacter subsaxonicus]|uniref:Long-chain fatty acid transport protein n=2 Tax=Rivibacter subsaxonicus TaxID=457575 RepID=A0A4Q7VNA5_9BURK|nr:long-chain fatty acid transport protein [Rivibacter subsaxonicus]